METELREYYVQRRDFIKATDSLICAGVQCGCFTQAEKIAMAEKIARRADPDKQLRRMKNNP